MHTIQPANPTALIGRQPELDRIHEAIRSHPQGGGALLFTGDPGIGKSELLSAAQTIAGGQGFDVLRTAGVELEVQWAYAGLYELLAPLLDQINVLPELERVGLATAFGLASGPTPETLLVARAALKLILTANPVPPVLLVDDVHWLDAPTLEVVAYLARQAGNGAFTLIGAARTGHDAQIASVPAERVEVAALDPDFAARLLALRQPNLTALDADRVLLEARGNPLAIVELPFSADSGGPFAPLPRRLERAFGSRIEGMPEPTRALLLLAALEPDASTAELNEAATLIVRDTSPSDLQPAIGARLADIESDRLIFRHPLVRSAVLSSESLERQQTAHRALSRSISDPYRAIIHRSQSTVGPDEEVAAELESVAATALSRGAVTTAVACLERAAPLSVDPRMRARRLLLAAEHAFGIGREDLVRRLLSEANRGELDSLERARMQWLREIFEDGVPGDAGRVIEMCEAADDASRDDPGLALELLLAAALRCWWADAGAEAVTRVTTTTLRLATKRPELEKDARFGAALGVADPIGQGARVAALLRDQAQADLTTPSDLRILGMAAHAIGDEPLASDLLSQAASHLRREGRVGLLAQVLSMTVAVLVELGDLDGATAAAREGVQLAEESGQPIWTTGTTVCEARVYALRGETDRAYDLAAQAELAANRGRLNDLLACVGLARGSAALAEGDRTAAFQHLSRLFDPGSPSYHVRERFGGIALLASACDGDQSRREAARRTVAGLRLVAEITPSPLLHAHLLCANALLAADDERDAALREARAVDLTRWPWVLAHIELADGMDGNVEALRRARAIFHQIGAHPWVEVADAELARPRAYRHAGRGDL